VGGAPLFGKKERETSPNFVVGDDDDESIKGEGLGGSDDFLGVTLLLQMQALHLCRVPPSFPTTSCSPWPWPSSTQPPVGSLEPWRRPPHDSSRACIAVIKRVFFRHRLAEAHWQSPFSRPAALQLDKAEPKGEGRVVLASILVPKLFGALGGKGIPRKS